MTIPPRPVSSLLAVEPNEPAEYETSIDRYDERADQWLPLDSTVNIDSRSIVAPIDRFGLYAIFIHRLRQRLLDGRWQRAVLIGVSAGVVPRRTTTPASQTAPSTGCAT